MQKYVTSMYLKVPRQGSPNTLLLGWSRQVFWLSHSDFSFLRLFFAKHLSVRIDLLGHLKPLTKSVVNRFAVRQLHNNVLLKQLSNSLSSSVQHLNKSVCLGVITVKFTSSYVAYAFMVLASSLVLA